MANYKLTGEDIAAAEQFAKATVKAEFPEYHTMYVDLSYLKDTRMGLLLSLCSRKGNEHLKPLLIERLAEYNYRPIRNFTFNYPEIAEVYSEELLEAIYTEPKNSNIIFNHAPDTILMSQIFDVLSTMSSTNRRADAVTPITVTINTWPLTPGKYYNLWLEIIQTFKSGVEYHTITMDPKTISAQQWGRYDFMYIEDIVPLIQSETPFAIALSSQKFLAKAIRSPYNVNPTHYEEWVKTGFDYHNPKQRMLRFAISRDILNIITKFEYFQPIIPTGE